MTLSLTVWARCRLEQCSSAGDLMERRPRLDLTETIVDIRYILSTMNQNRTRELKEREFSQYYFDRPERFSVLNCMCCLEHFPSWILGLGKQKDCFEGNRILSDIPRGEDMGNTSNTIMFDEREAKKIVQCTYDTLVTGFMVLAGCNCLQTASIYDTRTHGRLVRVTVRLYPLPVWLSDRRTVGSDGLAVC